jgi:hypothetical protein
VKRFKTQHHECVRPKKSFWSRAAYDAAELQHAYEERIAALKDQELLDQATEANVAP